MAKPGGVVAPDSPFCRGRRNYVGAVDGRISEEGFVRERKWVSKTLGNNGDGKVNILFWLRARLHRWKCSGRLRVATLGGGLLGGLVRKKVSRV